MLEFQLLLGAVSFAGLVLIALGQPAAPSRARVRANCDDRAVRARRIDR